MHLSLKRLLLLIVLLLATSGALGWWKFTTSIR